MAEQTNLSAPVGATLATPRWLVESVSLYRGYSVAGDVITANPASSSIKVTLIGEHGHRKSHQWIGASADNDIVALNKVNLSTKSLHKRIMEKLIDDGIIAGTIAGSPD